MIDFIFGDAGSGKSRYVYKWICEEAVKHTDKQYYLFVPEQNTLNAQRQMIKISERHGILNTDILSFQLLAYRVMEELGIEAPVLIDDVSKSILLRKAVMDSADKLTVYKNKVNSAGFINQLKNLISEFYQYDVDPEMLKTAGRESELPLLGSKISDVCCIYDAFREILEEKSAIPEQIACKLLSCIESSVLLNGAVIVFDGYTGFTPIQLRLLEHIIPKASRCRFAVTIPVENDPYRRGKFRDDSITDLFWLSRETIAKVCTIAEKNNIPRGADTDIRSDRRPAGVSILKAESPEDEVKLLARSIRINARQHGIRYRKMAVAVSDPSVYAELIKSEFESEEIPLFIDDRAVSSGNPVIGFIKNALAVIDSNYRYEDIMAFLRNPLICTNAEKRENTDLLDNYLRRTGKRGRKALEVMTLPIDFELLDKLGSSIKEAENISGKTGAVRKFCEDAELRERTDAFAGEAEKKGYIRQADECRRFVELIPDLFNRMQKILGNESVKTDEFCRLINAGFDEMKGGLIPETMDMVTAGDLKRSRFDELDTLYILGANEGLIPSAVTGGGIFTDYERNEIEKFNVVMAPDDKTDSCIQKFYLRMILNKPTERLIISYSGRGRDGKQLKASPVLAEIENGVYSDFDISEQLSDSENAVSSEADAAGILASLIGSSSGKKDYIRLLYRALVENGNISDVRNILEAAVIKANKGHLSEETAGKLYSSILKGSVSRIEDYEGCPFRHFIDYGLGLKEREQFNIESVDIGNLYHSSLDGIFREIKERNSSITELDIRELDEISNTVIDKVISEYNDNILAGSARNRYIAARIRKITHRTMNVLKKQLECGDFGVSDTEVDFTFREEGLRLHGVIDRIDRHVKDGKTFVKIIDYKSGKKTFSVSDLANGLELQLVTYMDSAVKKLAAEKGSSEGIIPAGMFYYNIDDPLLEYSPDITADSIESKKFDSLKMQGALSDSCESAVHLDSVFGDDGSVILDTKELKKSRVIKTGSELLSEEEFRKLMDYAGKRISADAKKILSGDIEIRPYRNGNSSKCDYCAYHGICGFDRNIEGFEYRNIRKYDRAGSLEFINHYGEDDAEI